jgi:AAA-like domain/CHAT domain
MSGVKGNPYSIDQPAEALFYGRQDQVDRFVANLTAPTAGSFALIGGRRFGKTSLLHAVERQLWATILCPPDDTYCVIPVYLNLLSDEITDWGDFFLLVVDSLRDQIAEHCPNIIPDNWNISSPADSVRPTHRVFADKLLKLCQSSARRNKPVRVVLLLDETEEILDKPWRTNLFNRLRWLIYEEQRTRNYLKIILAGSSSFYNDVRQRSSPLWGVLTFEFLTAFPEEETRRLIQEPCNGQVPEIVARDVAQCSGGHPYVVQYLMHHLWQEGLSKILPRHVDELSEQFKRERWSQLDGWRKSIGEVGCRAYSILLLRADWMDEDAIRKAIGGPTPELVPALTALCYHGWAIHDDDWRYCTVGELVRDWFTRNVGLGLMRDAVQEQQGEKLVDKISILFLAADPTNASRLRLGEEFREIDEQLTLAKQRDQFNLTLPQLSLRPRDIARALLNVQPQIVHFSGHGTSEGTLCFENEVGQIHIVQPDALAALFEQFAHQVNCVVLNACYSEIQAKIVAKYINHVIGMNKAIGDKAAIAFSTGFYQALGAGRTIEEAYKLGCVQIRLQGIPEHLTPILVNKEQVYS